MNVTKEAVAGKYFKRIALGQVHYHGKAVEEATSFCISGAARLNIV